MKAVLKPLFRLPQVTVSFIGFFFFSVFLVFMLQHIIYKLCAIHLFVCIR